MAALNTFDLDNRNGSKKGIYADRDSKIDDDDLSQKEFELLQESYKELLMIKDGAKKAMPVSELWKD